jgi:hypothetical protein
MAGLVGSAAILHIRGGEAIAVGRVMIMAGGEVEIGMTWPIQAGISITTTDGSGPTVLMTYMGKAI